MNYETRTDKNGVAWVGKELRGMWCDGCGGFHKERVRMWFPRDTDAPGINTEIYCEGTIAGSSYFTHTQIK